MIKKRLGFSLLIGTILIFLVFLSGCAKNVQTSENSGPESEGVDKQVVGTEYIGGKYNLSLKITEVRAGNRTGRMKMISYEKKGQIVEPDQMLPDNMRPGLDWLKQNTPENARIMSWWDYGHAIRAYSEREPVVDAPSKESLVTTVSKHLGNSPDEMECPGCVPHEILRDVASLLLTKDTNHAVEIMNKYNAVYLYVHSDDRIKKGAFFIILEQEQDSISETLLGNALTGDLEAGFDLVYEDSIAFIYRLSQD